MVLEGLAGVLTGLIGNVVTSITNYKTQKLKNAHDVSMAKIEHEAMIAEAEIGIKVTEAQVQGELLQLEEKNYGENLKLANQRTVSNELIEKLFANKWTAWLGTVLVFLLGCVDFMKGFMRPGLTLYLVALTTWITLIAQDILSAKADLMSVSQAEDLFVKVVDVIVYLTVSVVTWWFADRRVAKFLYRLNDGNLR